LIAPAIECLDLFLSTDAATGRLMKAASVLGDQVQPAEKALNLADANHGSPEFNQSDSEMASGLYGLKKRNTEISPSNSVSYNILGF
jgi:hypothetical protein